MPDSEKQKMIFEVRSEWISHSARMIKGVERVAPILKFEFSGMEVKLH